MKKFSSIATCALSIALLFSACTKTEVIKDPNPFEGVDNYLSSFVLTSGENTYEASLSGETITVTVPINVSLSGAAATYALCEHASISPDPATITDWDSEQVFRVKSYTGESRDYSYKVKRTEVPHEGNITLLTQADVDAFGKSGATVIEGSLIIGSAAKPDPETAIVNLDGLSAVKEVRYHVILNSSYSGTELAGLKNLETCGGFYIGNATSKIAFPGSLHVALPALRMTGDLVLKSDSVKVITLSKLQSAGSLTLSSKEVRTVDFGALKEIAGDLSISTPSNAVNNQLTELTFSALTTVGGSLNLQYYSGLSATGFSKLTYIGGGIDVTLNSNALEELHFPALETANGIINIERAPGITSIALPKVKHITSFIYNKTSYGNYPLASLNLSALESIADEFYIRSIPLESLSMPKLQSVGGNFTIWSLQSMTTMNTPALTKIGGKLYLSSTSLLASLDLSKVAEFGSLELVGCLKLTTISMPASIGSIIINCASNAECPIPVFNGLESVTGEFSFTSCSNTALFSIPNIKKIGIFKLNDGAQNAVLTFPDVQEIKTLDIGSYKLAELSAPKLTKVDNLNLSNIWALATITVPKLKTVTTFSLDEHGSYNKQYARMTNLDAFAGITSIGEVNIKYCGKLNDFTGLSGAISGLTAEKWAVSDCDYNPTFEDMQEGRYVKTVAQKARFWR